MPETWTAADGTVVTIRPISAADLELEQEFVNGLSTHTGYRRLMSSRALTMEEIKRFTDIDPRREVALIATVQVQGRERQVGVVRCVDDGEPGHAEFAIVLSDDWQGRGLGAILIARLITAAEQHGVRRLVGMTMSENTGMIRLGRKLGFRIGKEPGNGAVTILTLDLAA